MNRVFALWSLLALWALRCLTDRGHALRVPLARGAAFAGLIVGTVLNALNRENMPSERGTRLIRGFRGIGNFAVPLALAVTSKLLI